MCAIKAVTEEAVNNSVEDNEDMEIAVVSDLEAEEEEETCISVALSLSVIITMMIILMLTM